MTDSSIKSVAQLREIIGPEFPGLEQKVMTELDRHARAFISKCPFLVMSTSDSQGRLDTSPKGDVAGFVLVENDASLVIPDRPGNRMIYGHQEILENPKSGCYSLFPARPRHSGSMAGPS